MIATPPIWRWAAAVAAASFCPHALGQSLGAIPVFVVGQPWVAPSVGRSTTEAYMDLTSSAGVALIAARSDAADRVALRAPGTRNAGGQLTLPQNVMIRLAPRRHRLLLIGLARPLKLGDRVALTLTIRDATGARQDIPVDAEVRLRAPLEDERRAHRH